MGSVTKWWNLAFCDGSGMDPSQNGGIIHFVTDPGWIRHGTFVHIFPDLRFAHWWLFPLGEEKVLHSKSRVGF